MREKKQLGGLKGVDPMKLWTYSLMFNDSKPSPEQAPARNPNEYSWMNFNEQQNPQMPGPVPPAERNPNEYSWMNFGEQQTPVNPNAPKTYDISSQTGYNPQNALNNGQSPWTPQEDKNAIPPRPKAKVDPYFALRGATTGLTWLANRMERNRQDQYMYNQYSTLGQIDPANLNDYQPTPYNQYFEKGGELQQGGTPEQFEKDWMNSPIYRKRNVPPETTASRLDAIDGLGQPIKVTENFLRGFLPKGSKVRPVAMYNGQTHKINTTDDAPQDAIGHEIFHAATKGDILIPRSEGIDSEQRASLQNLRYGMYNNGVPVFDREINQDDLKLMKNSQEYKYLKRLYKKDEDILNFLRTTSGTDNQDDMTTVQKGGTPIVVNNPNDPRLKAYQDSLSLYNVGNENYKDYINALDVAAIDKKDIWTSNNPFIPNSSIQPVKMGKVRNTGSKSTRNSDGSYTNYTTYHSKNSSSSTELLDTTDLARRVETPYFLYKKPVQPVVYQKDPQLQKPTVRNVPIGLNTDIQSNVNIVPLQQAHTEQNTYRVEYTDPQTGKDTHQDFPNEKAGKEFQKAVGGNRTGYYLKKGGKFKTYRW